MLRILKNRAMVQHKMAQEGLPVEVIDEDPDKPLRYKFTPEGQLKLRSLAKPAAAKDAAPKRVWAQPGALDVVSRDDAVRCPAGPETCGRALVCVPTMRVRTRVCVSSPCVRVRVGLAAKRERACVRACVRGRGVTLTSVPTSSPPPFSSYSCPPPAPLSARPLPVAARVRYRAGLP
jgi:hypothetical protein